MILWRHGEGQGQSKARVWQKCRAARGISCFDELQVNRSRAGFQEPRLMPNSRSQVVLVLVSRANADWYPTCTVANGLDADLG
jgi:hypothetical protein